uniref:Uncharacterized protein n=1 Tax=Salix viminalis TaxID=40686 RepID=A0A6N2MD45_SALVM
MFGRGFSADSFAFQMLLDLESDDKIIVRFMLGSSQDEKLVLKVEARDCHKVWTCKGQDRCWEDCKNRYSGKGLCDLYTAPPVPKQCFCAYKC